MRNQIKPVFDFLLGKETRLSIQTLMYDGHIKSSGILARHLEKAWVIQNQENGLRSFCAVPPPTNPPKRHHGKQRGDVAKWLWHLTQDWEVAGSIFPFLLSLRVVESASSPSGGISNQGRLCHKHVHANHTKGGCATSMCMLTTPREAVPQACAC